MKHKGKAVVLFFGKSAGKVAMRSGEAATYVMASPGLCDEVPMMKIRRHAVLTCQLRSSGGVPVETY